MFNVAIYIAGANAIDEIELNGTTLVGTSALKASNEIMLFFAFIVVPGF